MRISEPIAVLIAAAVMQVSAFRYITYIDQWHTTTLPGKATNAGITHVITAFAQSTIFNTGDEYNPFEELWALRPLFDDGVKFCMAIGGWGDNTGFSTALATDQTRKTFAANVAKELSRLGYDCVDIDYEYPGGNGQDWKQVSEIAAFPILLGDIKAAIGDKELSIAAPGRVEDMIAYTANQTSKISDIVDFVNVMTYDLMNRRMNQTRHHTDVAGSLASVDTYISRGMDPAKINLGLAFYAKWFTTAEGIECTAPIGCPTVVLEDESGIDTLCSGAVTFEQANYDYPPAYGVPLSFTTAMQNGKTDEEHGGQWYWDAPSRLFWTWDTPDLIQRKFDTVIASRGLGGVFSWSLGQDSHDWSHLQAMRRGVEGMPYVV